MTAYITLTFLVSLSIITSLKAVDSHQYEKALEDYEKVKSSAWSWYRIKRVKKFIATAEDYRAELKRTGTTRAQMDNVTRTISDAEHVLVKLSAQDATQSSYLRTVFSTFFLSIFDVYSVPIWSTLASALLVTMLSVSLFYWMISYAMRAI